MIINIVAILGTITILHYLPDSNHIVEPRFNNSISFFYFAVFIAIFKFISGGGFEGSLKGTTHGTLISFISLFFNVNSAFFFAICLQKNLKNVFVILAIYVILMTALGSRSAIIGILLIALMLPLFKNNDLVKRKLRILIILLSIISPLLFLLGTSVRGGLDRNLLGKIIIGRISFIESSMIPLAGRQNNTMDELTFDKKYSTLNQFKQVINAISPIDPFLPDISPNQYFRQIFLGASESKVQNSYMSMNMTLPVYFVMKSNIFIGICLTIIFLSLLYLIWIRFSSNIYIFIAIVRSLYDILYYFDWVMIVQVIFSTTLTLITLKYYDVVINSIKYTTKKYFINPIIEKQSQ